MSDRTHISLGVFADAGANAWYSSATKNVHVDFVRTGLSISLPVDDARRLRDSLSYALDAAEATEQPSASGELPSVTVVKGTESGMTELDVTLLPTTPQAVIL